MIAGEAPYEGGFADAGLATQQHQPAARARRNGAELISEGRQLL
jgi:hypothetical protein